MEHQLAGIAALLLVLIVGALFGRLHGSDGGAIKPIGDRVACGLLALPLVSIAVRLAFPDIHMAWVLAAPAPLAVYVVLLAGTDLGWDVSRKHFNAVLISGVGIIYIFMIASVLVFGI